jgi:hypothetical protein
MTATFLVYFPNFHSMKPFSGTAISSFLQQVGFEDVHLDA